MSPTILYISSILPARSETFVYREVFALRTRGVRVITASVHTPERGLGEPRLEDLADSAIPIYGAGSLRLVIDAVAEAVAHPIRAVRTLVRALCDAIRADDVPWSRRPRLLVQTGAALALARRARPQGVTRIHAHMAHVPTTIAMYAAGQLGIPFSFTGHANDIFPNRSLLVPKLRRAAFVSCISRWHQQFYASQAGVPQDRLPVIRCGVPEIGAQSRSGDPGIRGPLHILAVGRLIPKKGFDLLLDAIGDLAARSPSVAGELRVSIVGDGPQAADLASRAASLADNAGVPVALLGAQSNHAVRALMNSADLFVLPCRVDPGGDRDGIPVVLMEAMAAGVAVITGGLPAIKELVQDGVTGLMVEPGDAAGLAAAMERLSKDPLLRTRLGTAAQRWVAREFSEDVNIERLLRAMGLPDGSGTSAAPGRSHAERPDRLPEVA